MKYVEQKCGRKKGGYQWSTHLWEAGKKIVILKAIRRRLMCGAIVPETIKLWLEKLQCKINPPITITKVKKALKQDQLDIREIQKKSQDLYTTHLDNLSQYYREMGNGKKEKILKQMRETEKNKSTILQTQTREE